MIEVVCPDCDKTWNLLAVPHTHKYKNRKRVQIVTKISQRCPICECKKYVKMSRLVEGERGVI